jgi:hypothetical protein
MITVSHRVGRLGEFRFEQTITVPQMKDFAAQMSALVVGFGQRMVFVVDFRECEPVEQQIEAMFVGQIRSDNWALERSAFLLRPASPTTVQMERVIALGRNPARRAYSNLESLLAWVSPILTVDETQRVSAFFGERA